jgi:hypothetical protein
METTPEYLWVGCGAEPRNIHSTLGLTHFSQPIQGLRIVMIALQNTSIQWSNRKLYVKKRPL